MNKPIVLALVVLGLVLFSSSVSASFSLNIFLCNYFGNCNTGYYPIAYHSPAYYNYNDIYFDPPIYRTSIVYPTYYYSNRIYAPQYPSYYGRVANPTLREIGGASVISVPPTYNNPSYYYSNPQSCTSSQCYYN